MKSAQGETPSKNRGAESSVFLTSNKRRGDDLFFTARIGRTERIRWLLLDSKESLGDSLLLAGAINSRLTSALDDGETRLSKEHEFCAAHSLPAVVPPLSRVSRSKEPESAQYGSSGRKFPRREVAVERQRVSGSLESSGSSEALLSRRTSSHSAETNDNAL